MKLLVRRYVCDEQRKRDDFGVTEDDVMEVRQDISTLRYELIDIFNKNGMKTPTVNKDDSSGRNFVLLLLFQAISSYFKLFQASEGFIRAYLFIIELSKAPDFVKLSKAFKY